MEFFKNQLLLLLMIKSYDVSFYTLLLLISTFYTKDFILSFFPTFGVKNENDTDSETETECKYYNQAKQSNTNEGELIK